jgi:hypothetical protein
MGDAEVGSVAMGGGRDPIRLTVIAAIALLCVGAGILIATTLVGDGISQTGGRALGTGLVAVFFLLLATPGAALSRSRAKLAPFGYLTAFVALVAMAGIVAAVWGHPDESEGRALWVAGILAVAGAHASLLLMPRFIDAGRAIVRLRNATLAMLAIVAGVFVYEIASDSHLVGSKTLGILVILYVLAAIVLPIAQRSHSRASGLRPPQDPGGSAADLLLGDGYALVDGPHRLDSEQAAGERARLRAPDGRLVDLITYD